jgi:phosphohistidine phosphatase
MNRQLLILRHGKSDWSAGTDDFNRPLKKRGKRGAKVIAKWIRDQGLAPDLVISSPATRAIDTARRVMAALDKDAAGIETDERVYEATVEQLLGVLGDCSPDAKRVMLVGHNPGLEELLLYLVPTPPMIPEDGKLMPTAALACLTMPDDWRSLSDGSARLLHLIKPASLQ